MLTSARIFYERLLREELPPEYLGGKKKEYVRLLARERLLLCIDGDRGGVFQQPCLGVALCLPSVAYFLV